MANIFYVGLGGFIGASLRYLTGNVLSSLWGSSFPYGTATANVLGSFCIGIIYVILGMLPSDNNWLAPLRLFLVTGILGGFTTWSSFMLDSVIMAQESNYRALFSYLATNLCGSTILILLGFCLGKCLANRIIPS